MAVSQTLTLTQTSQSVEGNSSQVRILWKSTQSGASFNSYTRTAKYYVSINGGAEVVYSVSYTLPKGTTKTVLDITITVPHNADGTGSVSVRTWMDTNISEGVITKTSTLTLTTIPRATTPTFHANSVDMGGTLTIYMYRSSTAFTHDLEYSFAGSEYVSIAKDLDTVYYWAVPDLATKIPNAASGTVTIRCITKSNGRAIGAKTAIFTARVPGSVMPTISAVTATEVTPNLAAQFGAFVKGKSALSVFVAAAGAKGSTIKSCSTTLDGKVYVGTRFTSDVLATAGTVNLVTIVTDTRNRSVKLTTPITVQDYYPPVITAFSGYRVNTNGVAASDGTRLGLKYAYQVAPVGNKNTASMTIKYKRSTATSWSTLTTGTALQSSRDTTYTTTFSASYQFDIELSVVDWFGAEARYSITLPTADVILDIKADGKGLAFGKTSEFPGFEVAMPAAGESFKMVGVRAYELGSGYGHILYNNGLLLQWGSVSVTPTAINVVTQLRTVFPIPYAHRPHITGTLLANSPQVVDWALGVGSSETEALTGLVVYMTRSTLHATPLRWMAVGLADLTQLPEVTAE